MAKRGSKSPGQMAALREAHSLEVKGQKLMRNGPPVPAKPVPPVPEMKASAKADAKLKASKKMSKPPMKKGKKK